MLIENYHRGKDAISFTLLLCHLVSHNKFYMGPQIKSIQKRNYHLVLNRNEPSQHAVSALQHVCGIHVNDASDISVPAGLLSSSGFANYLLPVKLGQNERLSTYFSVKS